MTDTQTCSNCRFYNPIEARDVGKCHRYPPHATGDPPMYNSPRVSAAHWCGEWKAKVYAANHPTR